MAVSDRIETDSQNYHYDIFLKHRPEIDLRVPCSINVLDGGHISVSTVALLKFVKSYTTDRIVLYVIQVSDFSTSGKYKRFHPDGVLIVWEWELYNYDEDTEDNETTTEEDSSDNEVETESAQLTN